MRQLQKAGPAFCVFTFALLIVLSAGCSLPILEKPECRESRESVRRFYSLHLASDLKPSPETLEAAKPFLTSELFQTLSASAETDVDYFTQTNDYPRAFRVGECRVEAADHTVLRVLLLWRDESRTEQNKITVDARKVGDKWLISEISK